jgi:HEAT repeat protein
MTEKSKGHPLILGLLMGLVLLIPATAGLLFYPTQRCPYCRGLGLKEEPSGNARWIREADLVPRACDCCRGRFKVGRFNRWRWQQGKAPEPPVYRVEDVDSFAEVRRLRIRQIREYALEGVEEQPPTGRSHRPDLIPVLSDALLDEDYLVREEAAFGLVGMNHEQALPALAAALKRLDGDQQGTLSQGILRLARIPELRSAAVAALREAAEEGPKGPTDTRFYASAALMELREPCNSDIFLQRLKRFSQGSAIAIQGIVTHARKDAILLLIKEMAQRPPDSLERFAEALSQLTGENLGKDPTAWFRWFEKNKDRFPPQTE